MTTSDTAADVFVGEATVKHHLSGAQRKLGAQNRVGIGIIADRAGLLQQ